ncbi:MAG: nucleotidyltransferase family protein [bacterium]|nr:nucleotidyltransferase family protein [bacterium]
MDKEILKQKIRQAIEQSDFKDDIQKVSLFGSYAYGTPRPDSDVDLLIEFVPTARFGLFKYAGIQNYFEDELQKKVDMATPTALSKYIRREVIRLAEPVYAKK